MRLFPLAALFAALAVLPASADDKAEIKLNVKKGQKYTRTTEIKGEGKCTLEISGRELQFEAQLTNETKMAEEVQDVKDGAPVDVRRGYPTRRSSANFGMFGAQEQNHPLEGADLTCKGGAWTVAGGGEGAADAANKEKAADPLGSAIASGKVVTAGNTWDADKAKVKAWLESEFDSFEASESEMECKLAEFRDKDGHKCARIEVKAKGKGTFALQGGPKSEVTITMEGDVFFALDLGMVLLVKGKGGLKAEIEVQGDNPGKLDLDVPLEWTVGVKPGEAELASKPPTEKPKPVKPEFYPPPVR